MNVHCGPGKSSEAELPIFFPGENDNGLTRAHEAVKHLGVSNYSCDGSGFRRIVEESKAAVCYCRWWGSRSKASEFEELRPRCWHLLQISSNPPSPAWELVKPNCSCPPCASIVKIEESATDLNISVMTSVLVKQTLTCGHPPAAGASRR